MAIAPQIQIPGYAASRDLDFPPLAKLAEQYRAGQARAAMQEIGQGLSDGSMDYKAAAGRIAQTGNLDATTKFLSLAQLQQKQQEELAASNQFSTTLASLYGGAAAQPASPVAQPPAMPVPSATPASPAARAPVQPSSRVWGDAEAEKAGLYDPAPAPTQVAQAAPSTPAITPAAAPTNSPQGGFQNIGVQQIPVLLQAVSNPRLPAAQKELAGKLLTRALDEAKTPEKIRTLQMLKQQSGYQGTILDLEKEMRAASKAEVNVNTKGETKFEEELGKGQAKRFIDMAEAGSAAERKLVDINAMRDISARIGSQGVGANIREAIGPYAEALGVPIDGLSDIQAYSSIVQRLAPQQRAPGSGSTSDIEFKGFLKSLPTLTQNPQAREMTLNTMEALTRDEMARGEIASLVASGELKRGDAERRLRALPDPMKGFVEWRKQNAGTYGQALKGGAAPGGNTTKTGIKWSVE